MYLKNRHLGIYKIDRLVKRKNIRLKDYDYSKTGYYFITICAKDRTKIFWTVGATCGRQQPHYIISDCENAEVFYNTQLSEIGYIVDLEINRISQIYDNVEINKYVIMPNHIHMIVVLEPDNGRSKTVPTIPRIIQQFKGTVSKKAGILIWQKSYFDHIIRNQREYQEIWEYIDTNPLKWTLDKYYG